MFASYLPVTPALPVTSASGPLPLDYSNTWKISGDRQWHCDKLPSENLLKNENVKCDIYSPPDYLVERDVKFHRNCSREVSQARGAYAGGRIHKKGPGGELNTQLHTSTPWQIMCRDIKHKTKVSVECWKVVFILYFFSFILKPLFSWDILN